MPARMPAPAETKPWPAQRWAQHAASRDSQRRALPPIKAPPPALRHASCGGRRRRALDAASEGGRPGHGRQLKGLNSQMRGAEGPEPWRARGGGGPNARPKQGPQPALRPTLPLAAPAHPMP